MSRDNYKEVIILVNIILVFFYLLAIFKPSNYIKELKLLNLYSDILKKINSTDSNSGRNINSPNRASMDSTCSDHDQYAKGQNNGYKDFLRFENNPPESNLFSIIHDQLIKSRTSEKQFRIAFVGDSFIEADIVTADVREQLQSLYGGRGGGFVPMASPASGYRQTVSHKFSGWEGFSIVNYKKADWSKLMLSGCYFVPDEVATASIKGLSKKKFLNKCSLANLLFQNTKNTVIKAVINDREEMIYTPPSSPRLQSITIDKDIESLDLTFSNTDGFYAYGVLMNDHKGVCLDNFSVRGSSGIVLSIINKQLCKELTKIVHYDMIILQFGLNVVSPNVTQYNSYKNRMVSVIQKSKSYFPDALFMIMGVSDRVMKTPDGGFTSMPGIKAMLETQRAITKETNVLVWDTFTAMGGEKSMIGFVNNNPTLANKDYTHLNHLGGKRIADHFCNSLYFEIS